MGCNTWWALPLTRSRDSSSLVRRKKVECVEACVGQLLPIHFISIMIQISSCILKHHLFVIKRIDAREITDFPETMDNLSLQ